MSAPTNATVTFVDANLTNTIVTFNNRPSNVGAYRLRLTVSDGQSAISSDVVITYTLSVTAVFSYGGTNDLYTYAARDILTNFYAVTNFNGSWTNGQAGFGNGYQNCGPTPNTPWPGYTGGYPYLYVRRSFNVPAGSTSMYLDFAIDNDARIFLNGVLLTPTNTWFNGGLVTQNVAQAVYVSENGFSTNYDTGSVQGGSELWLTNVFWHYGCCSYDNLLLNGIATNLWHTNANLLAVMAYDAGQASFLDSQITLIAYTAPTNQSLVVDAGPNKYTVLSQENTVALNGTVLDDAWPAYGPVTAGWSVVSGPDTNVVFSPAQPAVYNTNYAAVDTLCHL